jgi:hypothetical protein
VRGKFGLPPRPGSVPKHPVWHASFRGESRVSKHIRRIACRLLVAVTVGAAFHDRPARERSVRNGSTHRKPITARPIAQFAHSTLVQIDPQGVSLARIARGCRDPYLRSHIIAAEAFGSKAELSFGREKNGNWDPLAYRQTSTWAFVAAWRRMAQVSRAMGATNVIGCGWSA